MKIYCCTCGDFVNTELLKGNKIYNGRDDLKDKNFYKCINCGDFVGCHPNTSKALGCIVSKEIKNARIHIHELIDPLWQKSIISRGDLYKKIADRLGINEYHTANTKNIEECREVYKICLEIKKEFN